MSVQIRFALQVGPFNLDLDFEARSDGVTSLFGPSGSGKTTVLRCIAGLERPDQARLVVGGTVWHDTRRGVFLPPHSRPLGYVFQEAALFPHLNVWQNLLYGFNRVAPSERRVTLDPVVAMLKLEPLLKRSVRRLSGGEQQRVAIARSLLASPQLLLLDEPFSALDTPVRTQLRRDVAVLQKELNLPILLVTHDLAEAYFMSQRMAVLDHGKLLQTGPPETVMYHPKNHTVAQLTGCQNFFTGKVVQSTHKGLWIHSGQVTLLASPNALAVGRTVELAVRAERIMLVRKALPKDTRQNELSGTIVEATRDGLNHTLYFLLDDGQRLRQGEYDLEVVLPAYVYERLQLGTDQRWKISIRPEVITLLDS